MYRRAVVLVAVVAAMVCPTVVVGDAAKPILQLALQRADMPATMEMVQSPTLMNDSDSIASLGPFGVREAAHYFYSWPIDGASKTSSDSLPKGWRVSGEVYRASDESGAKRLFALGKSAGGLSSSYLGSGTKSLDVPPYGDEQFARVSSRSSLEMLVLVRKGTIVWEILVKPMLAFEPSEAQMVEVLKTYAAKQKARVGAR